MFNIQKRGRPRKDGERFPSGELKPLSPAEREKQRREAERQQKLAEERRIAEDTHLVHSQPHRRDDPKDGRRESPLGRFVAANRLKDEIHIGADKFGALVRRWRSLKGVPSDIRIPRDGVRVGDGPTDDEVNELCRRVERVRRAAMDEVMRVCGKTEAGAEEIFERIRAIAVDGRDIMILNPQPVIIALRVIAVEMGSMDGKDQPFDRRAA